MKKTLLLAATFLMTALGMQAAVGDDLTSKYLQNADFTADTPLHYGVTTYAKDTTASGTMFSGMQPVTGWTASNPFVAEGTDIDARACGVFELGKQYLSDYTDKDEDMNTAIFLGGTGFLTPAPSEGLSEGNVLGMVAVWGAGVQYTQAVTLPAGTYEIVMPVYNGGGEVAIDTNKFGFIADNGTSYCATETTWGVNTWTEMKASFTLTEATSGVISVGYKAANSGSASMPHLYLAYVKILEADPVAVDIAQAEKLKPTLLQYIEEGESLGADTEAAQAVYDNPNASLAEVEAAIENQKTINNNSQTDLSEFFIQNPHFNQDVAIEGGITTYDYDRSKNSVNYYGMQPVKGWTANHPAASLADNPVETNTGVNNGAACGVLAIGSGAWIGGTTYTVPGIMSDGTKEGNVLGFVTCWSFSTQYTQAVTIPAGKYTLSISYYNTGGAQDVAKNLMGFIADDGTEHLCDTKNFKIGSWETMRVSFELEEPTTGKFSVGYTATNTGSGNMPHFYIDGISLNYVGETKFDPSLFALQAAVTGAQAKLESTFNADLKTKLEDAINAGDELVKSQSADKEANVAATEAINNMLIEVNENIAAYESFREFLDGTYSNTIAKYDVEGSDLKDFAGELADDYDTYNSAWEEGEYTTEQINEIMNGFTARLATAVQTALDKAAAEGGSHNIDITCLFADKNLDFANSTVTGWQNETGTSAFLSRVQTAEVWNQTSFNCYQTLENLPAGVYELQIPGFYRTADNATNYSELQEGAVAGSAYIYAGGNKTLMHNLAEDQYLLHATESDGNHDAAITEGELYVVNSNANAHYYFYDQTEADCMNTVIGALAEAGTLTIGVKGENLESNEWTVWGAATITYKGTDGMSAALYAELQSKVETLNAVAETATIVTEADSKAQTALGLAEGCTETSSVEDLTAAIKSVDEATAYNTESASLIEELTTVKDTYEQYLMTSVESSDETFPAALESAGADSFEDNAAVEAAIAKIKDTWPTYVQNPVLETATAENPADISAAILNRGFEGITHEQTETSGEGNGDYWTKTRVGGNDFGYQAGVYESWNTDTFNISQSIKGLAAGYYRIKVQSFFRADNDNQANANAFFADTTKCAAYLYATTSLGEQQKQIVNQVENGNQATSLSEGNDVQIAIKDSTATMFVPTNRTGCAEYFAQGLYWNQLDVQVGEDGVLTLGIQKTTHVYGDWCPFDNFQLYYLGKTAPTAVESVKADVNTVANAAIYDLSGRQVSKAQKGIYIMNGKKVIR